VIMSTVMKLIKHLLQSLQHQASTCTAMGNVVSAKIVL